MARGGSREGAGRKSEWSSQGSTIRIRVPEVLAADVIAYAQKLDRGELLETEADYGIVQGSAERTLTKILEVIAVWKAKAVEHDEKSPRWQNVHRFLLDLEEAQRLGKVRDDWL
jgi:hypothetical protein